MPRHRPCGSAVWAVRARFGYRGALLGVPSKIEALTDMKSIALSRSHTQIQVDLSERREYVGCKILGRPSRRGRRPALQSGYDHLLAKAFGSVKNVDISKDGKICVYPVQTQFNTT